MSAGWEIGTANHFNLPSAGHNVVAEVDVINNTTYSQNITLPAESKATLTFDTRLRNAGTINSDGVRVVWNNT